RHSRTNRPFPASCGKGRSAPLMTPLPSRAGNRSFSKAGGGEAKVDGPVFRCLRSGGGCYLGSGFDKQQGGEWRDSLACVTQPVAQEVVERQSEFPAGLHKAQRSVTSHPADPAHPAPRACAR